MFSGTSVYNSLECKARSGSFQPVCLPKFGRTFTLFHVLERRGADYCSSPSLPSNVSRNEEHRLLTYSFIYSADIILLMIRKVNYWLISCSHRRSFAAPLPLPRISDSFQPVCPSKVGRYFHALTYRSLQYDVGRFYGVAVLATS